MSTTKKRLTAVVVGLGMAGTLAACGSSDGGQGSGDSKTVTLVSHDSWAASKDVIAAFEKQSGYKVDVLKDGDAGQAVNKAILTKDNPQGDVFFGVDNTLLSRALDNGLFQSYEPKDSDKIKAEYRVDQDRHRVTPSTPATSASTTTRSTSPTTSWSRRRASTTWSSPSTRTCWSPRMPPPPRPASASCSAPPPGTATGAGRATGRSSRPTA